MSSGISSLETGLIYLDNAATSWPKPPGVAAAMHHFLDQIGANPGRSGHRLSVKAGRIIYETREAVASLFGAPDPLRVVFGMNATDGINLALHGILKPGDHVITSGIEHNAVMRPLHDLETGGVEVTQIPCFVDGSLDPAQVELSIRSNTKLIALNHASNVCGTILLIREVGQMARQKNLFFLVDVAQSAGVLPIDMEKDCIDFLAFTGHKSLYGPMGTGGLVIGKRIEPEALHPLRQGGTGSRSEREIQPEFFPDRYESGTMNAVGLSGLLAALQWLQQQGIDQIRSHEMTLCTRLIEGLLNIPNVTVYGPTEMSRRTATVGFNIQNMEPSTVGLRLDEEFGILCRIGLHCAPSAHRTIGTFPNGCVRFSIGAFNTERDIERALKAVNELAKEAQ